jgi:hypothetical protein
MHRRARSYARVWLDPGGYAAPIDCKVQDMCASGAKITPLSGQELPDSFTLHLPSGPAAIEATVVWRQGATVGVCWANPSL